MPLSSHILASGDQTNLLGVILEEPLILNLFFGMHSDNALLSPILSAPVRWQTINLLSSFIKQFNGALLFSVLLFGGPI